MGDRSFILGDWRSETSTGDRPFVCWGDRYPSNYHISMVEIDKIVSEKKYVGFSCFNLT